MRSAGFWRVLLVLAGAALIAGTPALPTAVHGRTSIAQAEIQRDRGPAWSLPDSVRLLSLESVPERGHVLVVTPTGFDEFHRGRSEVWFLPAGANTATVIARAGSDDGAGRHDWIFSRTVSCPQAIAVQLAMPEASSFVVYDYAGHLLATAPVPDWEVHPEWCFLIGWAHDSRSPTEPQSPRLYALTGCAGAWERPLDCFASGPGSGLGYLVRVALSPLAVDLLPVEQDLRGLALAAASSGDLRTSSGF